MIASREGGLCPHELIAGGVEPFEGSTKGRTFRIGRSKRIPVPYFRRWEPLFLTASGFPTRGRAHPSARGSSRVIICREKFSLRVEPRRRFEISMGHGRAIGQAPIGAWDHPRCTFSLPVQIG